MKKLKLMAIYEMMNPAHPEGEASVLSDFYLLALHLCRYSRNHRAYVSDKQAGRSDHKYHDATSKGGRCYRIMVSSC